VAKNDWRGNGDFPAYIRKTSRFKARQHLGFSSSGHSDGYRLEDREFARSGSQFLPKVGQTR
jgi:L-asparaginase II